MQHFFVSLVVALGAACPALGQDRQGPIKIGVLAKRGAERCLAKWGPTAQYLTDEIPGHPFIIVPLGYGEVCPAVDRGEVDFVLANPFVHVEIEDRYGASALATLISLHFGVAYTSYGGAILHRAGRDDIKCLADLKGKTFMAVADTSFGGWLIAWREMKEQGIDPHRDFADLRFGGRHDAVVCAVLEGQADAGTVRTDTLERMESEGKINLRDFSVIRGHLGSHVHHPFLHSTRSYPEWPFAKVKHTSDGLAQQVAVALLGMPVDSPAAKAARCAGWAVPHNYQAVHECLKELRVGPYQDYGKTSLGDVLRRYWVWIASVAVVLAGMAVTIVWALRLLVQRTRAEEALRESEGKLSAMLQSLGDHVSMMDKALNILWANDVAKGLFGDDIIGKKCYEVYHGRNKPCEPSPCLTLQAFEDGQIHKHETRVQCPDGRTLAYACTASVALRDDEGNPTGVIEVSRDITDRKRAEQAIREERDRAQGYLDVAGTMIVLLDPSERIILINQKGCDILGYQREELLGQNWFNLLVPQRIRAEVRGVFQKLMAGDITPVEYYENPLFTRDGEERLIAFHNTVLTEPSGRITAALFSAEDISDRKRAEEALRESEEKYRHLFEQLNDAAFLADAETGIILDTNAQAEALLGGSRDEIIGIHQSELHPPGKSGEYQQKFAKHVAIGRIADYDSEVIKKDGSVLPVTISAATLTLGGKQLILGLFHDTTDRQQLEEQLRQAQKMEAVGTLASGVAHDFNNLLTAIFGYTDLARATLPEGHPAAHSLEMVEQAARQAGGVSRSLLTFSRKAASRKSPVNFGEVVHQAVRFLRRVLPASIEVIEELSVEGDLWGMADAAQIQQVLMNLAVNSRDAMPEGGRLRIRLVPGPAEALGPVSSEEGQPASTAVLVVEDTGAGMPPEVRSRIFEPFFTTKPRGQGTGLGMSVIHGIVTDHGGRIEVESEPQRGTRVTISLPCSVPSDADRREQAEPGGAGRGADHDAVIIVVEDDEHVRSIMCSTLRSEGYEAVPAGDGLEAAAALQTHAAVVRLVLLDLDLPRRSGVSVLREIRETKMDLPVIVVTGGVGFDPAEHLDGSERLLLKPFHMSELVSLVAQTLADSGIELGVEP